MCYREEAKGEMDKRVVTPLIACYSSVLYPEEHKRTQQAGSPAPLPSTPAKACEKPALRCVYSL